MKVIVIKCGGSIIDELSPSFFYSLCEMKRNGYLPVFVHGGGPDINDMLEMLQIPSEFYDGLRKTTKEILHVAEMVLTGKTNRKLTEQLSSYGFKAFGVGGSDGKCLQAQFVNKQKLGYVGEITAVNKKLIQSFLDKNYVPVITPIAVTKDGQKLNVNADYAAAAVAAALDAEQCLFVTDVEGIMVNNTVVDSVSITEIDELITDGTITGGMIPKVNSAIAALNKGLQSTMIVSGKSAIYQDNQFLGTEICKKERVLQ